MQKSKIVINCRTVLLANLLQVSIAVKEDVFSTYRVLEHMLYAVIFVMIIRLTIPVSTQLCCYCDSIGPLSTFNVFALLLECK